MGVAVGVLVLVLVGVVVGVGVAVGVAVSLGVGVTLMVADGAPALGDGVVVGVGVGGRAIGGSPPAGLLPDRPLVAGPGSTPMGMLPGPVSSLAEERALDGSSLGREVVTELAGLMNCCTRPSAKAPATTMATAPATARTGRSPAAAGPRRTSRPIAGRRSHATNACARRLECRGEASR